MNELTIENICEAMLLVDDVFPVLAAEQEK
jgi:hypothetical protein